VTPIFGPKYVLFRRGPWNVRGDARPWAVLATEQEMYYHDLPAPDVILFIGLLLQDPPEKEEVQNIGAAVSAKEIAPSFHKQQNPKKGSQVSATLRIEPNFDSPVMAVHVIYG
jgi:hypothetical protein